MVFLLLGLGASGLATPPESLVLLVEAGWYFVLSPAAGSRVLGRGCLLFNCLSLGTCWPLSRVLETGLWHWPKPVDGAFFGVNGQLTPVVLVSL